MRQAFALVSSLLLTAWVGAQAPGSWSEWSNGRAFSNPGATSLDQYLQSELSRRVALGKAALAPNARLTASRFKLDPKYTVPTRIANAYTPNQAERATLAKRLTEAVRQFDSGNATPDVANAFANLFTLAYTIANKGPEIKDQDDANVLRQLRAAFEDPKVRQLSDAAKQEYYEWCICMGDILYTLYASALSEHSRRAEDYVKGQAVSLLKRLFKTEAWKIRVATGTPYPIRISD